jgi:hypothetical protein
MLYSILSSSFQDVSLCTAESSRIGHGTGLTILSAGIKTALGVLKEAITPIIFPYRAYLGE